MRVLLRCSFTSDYIVSFGDHSHFIINLFIYFDYRAIAIFIKYQIVLHNSIFMSSELFFQIEIGSGLFTAKEISITSCLVVI